jgi:hypothetical protein
MDGDLAEALARTHSIFHTGLRSQRVNATFE